MRFRRIITILHKWLGLALSLWLLLIALTGTLLLFKTELLQLTYPQLNLPAIPSQEQAAKVFDQHTANYGFVPSDYHPWIEIVDEHGARHYYSGDGELLGQFAIESREYVALNEIPLTLQKAFLATEDDEFYDHNVKLIISAEVPIADLYAGERLRSCTSTVVSSLWIHFEPSTSAAICVATGLSRSETAPHHSESVLRPISTPWRRKIGSSR